MQVKFRKRTHLYLVTSCLLLLVLTVVAPGIHAEELKANFRLYGEMWGFGLGGWGDMDIHFGVNGVERVGRIEKPVAGPVFSSGVLPPLLPDQKVVDLEFSVPFSLEAGEPASMYIGFGDNGLGGFSGGSVQYIFDFSDNIYFYGSVLEAACDQGLRLVSITLADGRPLADVGLKFEIIQPNTLLIAGASAFDDIGAGPTTATGIPPDRAAVNLSKSRASAKLLGGTDGFCGPTASLVDLDVNPEPDPFVFDMAFAVMTGTNNILLTRISVTPTANAGLDQTVSRNAPVILDGSASADPQGGDLSYAWTLTGKPAGSAAALTGADTATPSFTPDLPGNYEVTLVVANASGVASAPDTVVYSTVNSAPVADAGPDQPLLREGETIRLDGSQSWDDDGDPLAYAWSFTARPDGSTASLSGATTANPYFVVDQRGTYTALLTVRDSFGGSGSDSVTISFENVRPVADAGNNDVVPLGGTAVLDGGGSVDANGDPLTYAWSLAERPAGSTATLDDPAAVAPRFRTDRYGDYRLSLTVSDGELTSEPSAVTISCLRQDGDAERFLVTAIDMVNLMDEGEFKNASMRNTLTQKLTVILKQLAQGQTAEAVQKLREDVLAKTDGCTAAGGADKNDWITGCAAQRDLVPLLETVVDILQ